METLTVVRDPRDVIAASPPVAWAVDEIRKRLLPAGIALRTRDEPAAAVDGPKLLVAGAPGDHTDRWMAEAGVGAPATRESFALVPDPQAGVRGMLAYGVDPRGLVYGLLDLADRLTGGSDPMDVLRGEPTIERPANQVRSVARLFCSEIEDRPWFSDLGWWDRYLSMLIAQRFNRFSLTFGLGYNYHRAITDASFYFAYPFLVSVPGYDVRVQQLPPEERERNLETLRAISELASARGLDFQLGLWTHAYDWLESPDAHQTISGLTPDRHAAYCRDAIHLLLDRCPAIGGVTLRIHGESGVPEGSWDFWRTVFEGVATTGREVGIDLHAKGLDDRTLGDALDTGLPVTVSPKFSAEHMGLPYHQAAIRESERATRDDPGHLSEWHRFMRVSEGSRPFTRYGYADFLREDRAYAVVFRIWAGTQRLLAWGDPAMASGYGRAAHIAGTQGFEWCEPLTFKGREGTGVPGSRTGYADPVLLPHDDWEKFAYAYRLFGRLGYDPEARPIAWRPFLHARLGEQAADAEAGLAAASRILPLVSTAHHPSASNNYYWPEIYTDMPIVWSDVGTRPHPYLDTPRPRRFGTVSPLDPEVFSSVSDFVAETLAGEPSGRISPMEVAAFLERLAQEAADRARNLRSRSPVHTEVDVRRLAVDIAVQAALGRFFAGKLRAAAWFEAYATTGEPETHKRAVDAYRSARDAWLEASAAGAAYERDLTFGRDARLRGHWEDRAAAIQDDLGDMERRPDPVPAHDRTRGVDVVARLLEATAPPPATVIRHDPPPPFVPGEDLCLHLACDDAIAGVTLRYRPMNHALPMLARVMERAEGGFEASVPANVLDGSFPIAYAFVVRTRIGRAWRYPGLGNDLASQPYFVVRPDRS
jgi:hypothetical protein